MKPLAERSTFRIGIAGGIGLLVMCLLLAFISYYSFGQTKYTSYFEHTAGLRVGEEVDVAGVSVGEVKNIALRGKMVKVEFTLDKDLHLGDRTTAGIRVLTLLGTHYLEIIPKGAGSLRDATIPLNRTSVPYNLQDVVEAAESSLEGFDSKKISESLTVMADALRGTPKATRAALIGVSRLSRLAADRSDQMREMLVSARVVTGKLAANSEDIITLLKDSNLVLAELVSRREVIHSLLVDSERLAKAIEGVIDDSEAEFRPLMKNLSSTLKLLRQNDTGLVKSIDGLASTAHYFANATGNGPWLDLHIPVVVPDNLACLNPNGGCK